MANRKNFSYHDLSDSLFVSCKKNREFVEGSVRLGSLILDFTREGKIAGIEIKKISKILSGLDINPRILYSLENVKMSVGYEKGSALVSLILFPKRREEQHIPLLIPLKR